MKIFRNKAVINGDKINLKKTINVHIYPSPFKHESRILKITKTLASLKIFSKIEIYAIWEPSLPIIEALDTQRDVIRINRVLGINKEGTFWKVLKTIEWSWKIINILIGKEVSCINCHSISVLPLGVILKLILRSKLVYDTHELETETIRSKGLRKLLAKIIEKGLIKYCDAIFVVNESIAHWYRRTYEIDNIWVIRNVPSFEQFSSTKTQNLKDIFCIPSNSIVFLYIGLVGYGRGIELLLKSFSQAGTEKQLIILGYGELVDVVKEYQENYKNIHYLSQVRPEELLDYVTSADIGLAIIENSCLNHYLCLPNKVFEYLKSKIPIIVSDFPELEALINRFDCGWKVSPDKVSILNCIDSISIADIAKKKRGALNASLFFDWRDEERNLQKAYREMGFKTIGKFES